MRNNSNLSASIKLNSQCSLSVFHVASSTSFNEIKGQQHYKISCVLRRSCLQFSAGHETNQGAISTQNAQFRASLWKNHQDSSAGKHFNTLVCQTMGTLSANGKQQDRYNLKMAQYLDFSSVSSLCTQNLETRTGNWFRGLHSQTCCTQRSVWKEYWISH